MYRPHSQNSAQEMTGSDLRRQAVSNGQVTLEICRFLSGKTGPQKPRERGPSQCANLVAASVAVIMVLPGLKVPVSSSVSVVDLAAAPPVDPQMLEDMDMLLALGEESNGG